MEKIDRNYLNELKTGVLFLDKFLKIKYLNSAAQSLLDTSFKSSKNKKLQELFFEESKDFDNLLENLSDKMSFSKVGEYEICYSKQKDFGDLRTCLQVDVLKAKLI